MESLFEDVIDLMNMGGPPIPNFCSLQNNCLVISDSLTVEDIPMDVKQQAFEKHIQTTGYNLFDQTKLTEQQLNNTKRLIINTSFYVFFSLFLIFTILLLVLMYYRIIDVVIGLYLIILFSLIIYIASVLYRHQTISHAISSTNVINQDILQNQMDFENSIAFQPQAIKQVSNIVF
jgi:hypothetical protein